MTGKELKRISDNHFIEGEMMCYYDWQAIANELDQRQDNEIQRLCEELRNAQTPYEHIATGTSVTFPNQRTCETCGHKDNCYQYVILKDTGQSWYAENPIDFCSLYTKEGK